MGEEQVDFEPAVSLEGKVEFYMHTILTAQRETLQKNLERSQKRYPLRPRTEWLLESNPAGHSLDPAQIAILVASIQSVIAIEGAMDNNALALFSDQQKQNLMAFTAELETEKHQHQINKDQLERSTGLRCLQ